MSYFIKEADSYRTYPVGGDMEDFLSGRPPPSSSAASADIIQKLTARSPVPVHNISGDGGSAFLPAGSTPWARGKMNDAIRDQGVDVNSTSFKEELQGALGVDHPDKLTSRVLFNGRHDAPDLRMLGMEHPEHILAHEVGHAMHDKTWLGGHTQGSMLLNHARGVVPLTSFGTGAAISGSGIHRGWHALGFGLNALPHAAQLFDEHSASSQGRKLIQDLVSPEQLNRYNGDMSKAFGTYLAGAAASTVVPYGLGMGLGEIIRHYRSKGKSEAEKRLGLQPKQLPA